MPFTPTKKTWPRCRAGKVWECERRTENSDLVSLDKTDTIDVPWGNWQRHQECFFFFSGPSAKSFIANITAGVFDPKIFFVFYPSGDLRGKTQSSPEKLRHSAHDRGQKELMLFCGCFIT